MNRDPSPENGKSSAVLLDSVPNDERPAVAGRSQAVAVGIVSHFPSVRAGLRVLLEGAGDLDVVGDAPSLEVLLARAARQPDAIVLDTGTDGRVVLPDEPAGSGLVLLGGELSAIRDLLRAPAQPFAMLRRDADGPELAAAVRAVAAGLVVLDSDLAGLWSATLSQPAPSGDGPTEELTPRELEVLRLLVEGIPNKAIALRLQISDHTVKFHVGSVLSKLGAASRTEAVRLAARYGLVAL